MITLKKIQIVGKKVMYLQSKSRQIVAKYDNDARLVSLLENEEYDKFLKLLQGNYFLNADVLKKIDSFTLIRRALEVCVAYDYDIYPELIKILGEAETDYILVKFNMQCLIHQKLSDESVEAYQLWDELVFREKYRNLLFNDKEMYIIKALPFLKNKENLRAELLKRKDYDLLMDCLDVRELKSSAELRRSMWQKRRWDLLLTLDESFLHEVSGIKDREALYENIANHGGEEALYVFGYDDFLLKSGRIRQYVKNKDWLRLYAEKYYNAIDLYDWLYYDHPETETFKCIINCAVMQKNWEFLVKNALATYDFAVRMAYAKALFVNWQWKRCFKILM